MSPIKCSVTLVKLLSETGAEVVTHHLILREAREWISGPEGSLPVRMESPFQLYNQSGSSVCWVGLRIPF